MSQRGRDAVKRQLPAAQKWEVIKEDTGPTDGRPRFDFVLVSAGQMTDRGHTGEVKLWFYNDRLMSVYFTPSDPAAYFGLVRGLPGAQLREHRIIALPEGAEVWRVGAASEGPMIEWYDPCLRDEQNSWIMEYS